MSAIDFSRKITEHYKCCTIQENDTVLFCASDIAKILNIKNISTSIIKYNKDEKTLRVSETNGGPQKKIFLSFDSLLKLLSKTRSKEIFEFCKKMDLKLNDTFIPSIEVKTLTYITNVFKDENMIHQYTVDKYRIDLYFVDYKLAIECDENDHTYKLQKNKDKLREIYIKNKINCCFLRYNPEEKDFDIFNLISLIFKHIKKSYIEYIDKTRN